MTVIKSTWPPANSSAASPEKLPEVPFEATIISIEKSWGDSSTHLHMRLAFEQNPSPTEETSEPGAVMFGWISTYNNLDPRVHLQEGDVVKVTYVDFSEGVIRVGAFEFDSKILARGFRRRRENQ